ncbi:aspartate/glutamate racemase family protein [Halalkalibacterium ligniniphilum]|uniref:aspartate/glutamate racemase family protein n=1 Tax=Halalkalibacterium ligniniphilum TaxID=1134413 RepID=UPI00034CBE9D|nr:aspartate/glutamate racemase family protein [Halalkalibacterium ligniniphilum]
MKKRILFINPLHTEVFDDEFRTQFERFKIDETVVDVVSFEPEEGPIHVEYNCYEAMVIPELIRTVKKAEEDGYDAAIIGCFYDPALRACREVTEKMVVTAPAEAALHIATTLGENVSIIVGRKKWIPEMKENVHKYGFAHRLASFKPLGLGVHDFQKDHKETKRRIREAALEAIEQDGADVIVLGCTAEFGFFETLQDELGVPVIDASLSPFKYAEFLVEIKQKLAWTHSKKAGYQSPPEDEVRAFKLFDPALNKK